MKPSLSRDPFLFAQYGKFAAKTLDSLRKITFPVDFVIMVCQNRLQEIKRRRKKTRGSRIMFKWFAVLYVDPQNLMTNRRNLLPWDGIGSEGTRCRHEGINNPAPYIVSP